MYYLSFVWRHVVSKKYRSSGEELLLSLLAHWGADEVFLLQRRNSRVDLYGDLFSFGLVALDGVVVAPLNPCGLGIRGVCCMVWLHLLAAALLCQLEHGSW